MTILDCADGLGCEIDYFRELLLGPAALSSQLLDSPPQSLSERVRHISECRADAEHEHQANLILTMWDKLCVLGEVQEAVKLGAWGGLFWFDHLAVLLESSVSFISFDIRVEVDRVVNVQLPARGMKLQTSC